MTKINYVSEKDFKEIEIEIEDEFYNVAEEIREYFDNNGFGIIYNETDNSLNINYQPIPRHVGEKNTHEYLIKITKIPYE